MTSQSAVFGSQKISIIVTFIFISERNLGSVLGNKSAQFCTPVFCPSDCYFRHQYWPVRLALEKARAEDKYSCRFSDLRYFMGRQIVSKFALITQDHATYLLIAL